MEAARIAYRAYGDRTGWRNFRGDPMPRWQDLGEVIQDAWRAAAAAVAEHVAGHVAERDAAPAGQTTGGKVTR